MTSLSKVTFVNTPGRALVQSDKNKSYIKEVVNINNKAVQLKAINTKVEEDVFLNIIDSLVKEDYNYNLQKKDKQLQIRVIIEGSFEKINHKTNEKISYKENHIVAEYNNDESSLIHKKGEKLKYLCITLKEKYLIENDFLINILEKNKNNNFLLNIYEPELKSRYLELFTREYSSRVDKIYIKNKTMDLIFFVLEKCQKNNENYSFLNDEDIKRIKEAKSILEKSFAQKITIPSLAKDVALNQSKLKKGFKELFEYTIHDYLKEIRLKKAIAYLESRQYSVKEVALMVGYTNQGSFSYAFSKKYNISPKQIIKSNNK